MRFFLHSISILAVLCSFSSLHAQDFAFRYQGVAYEGDLPISSDLIAVQLLIHAGSPSGQIAYSESRQDIPVQNGQFSVTVGSPGTISTSGLLNELDWGVTPYFLETRISINNDIMAATPIGVTEILGSPWLNPVHQIRMSSRSDLAPEYGDLYLRGGDGQAANYFGFYHADGSDNATIQRNFWFQGAGSRNMDVSFDNFVSIGSLKDGESMSHTLEVTGSACKSVGGTSWSVCSDPRIKTGIRPLELGLNTLMKINPIWFEYNLKIAPELGSGIRLGLNAEEIAQISELKELMIETHQKYGIPDLKMITSSDALMYISVNAIKEHQELILNQSDIILSQQKKLAEQEAQLTKLVERMEILENSVGSASLSH